MVGLKLNPSYLKGAPGKSYTRKVSLKILWIKHTRLFAAYVIKKYILVYLSLVCFYFSNEFNSQIKVDIKWPAYYKHLLSIGNILT